MTVFKRTLASIRYGVNQQPSRRCIVCCKSKDTNHSIFQVNSTSRFISLNDVKDALAITQTFSAYQRLKYFKEKGIHYTRALRYVRLVEQFEEALTNSKGIPVDQSYIEENEQDNYTMPRTSLSSEDIGRFINEVMQEREEHDEHDEHENNHLIGEAKPYLKQYDNVVHFAKCIDHLAKESKNICLLIIVMMFIHYLCDEWIVYVGSRT